VAFGPHFWVAVTADWRLDLRWDAQAGAQIIAVCAIYISEMMRNTLLAIAAPK